MSKVENYFFEESIQRYGKIVEISKKYDNSRAVLVTVDFKNSSTQIKAFAEIYVPLESTGLQGETTLGFLAQNIESCGTHVRKISLLTDEDKKSIEESELKELKKVLKVLNVATDLFDNF